MGRTLRVLNVDDSRRDATLLRRHLSQEDYEVIFERVDTPAEMKAALESKEWDVILADYSMPEFSAMKALALLQETGLDIPFIVVSGTIGEDLAVESMLAGASDYLMKGRLTRLAPAIERELGEAKSRYARHRAEEETVRLSAEVQQQRQKFDQQLRDQHFYTRSLIESNIDAMMTTDPRGIITDVNMQTQALTGRTRDELIGAPLKNYFTDSSRAEAGINRVLNEGKVTNYELTARARDGAQTVVSCNARTFHDRDGKLQGVFAALHDMTELKRFEHTLQQKNIELEEASRMKSEFLATMSHELRTPLNAIIGFAEVLRDGLMGELTEQQRGSIGNIFHGGQHLLSLINDILDLSKVEAGKMTLDLAPVQVSALFENGLSIVREKAVARQIRLNLNAAKELGVIQADARKVKQILYNLLSNAVKFTPEGGQVTLDAVRVTRAGVGQISRSRAGRSFPLADNEFEEFIKISVTNSGTGISPEGLEQLFKPFSQIDSGLASEFEGTGLGLAMVKVLAELHGGTVAVESAMDDGSCFTVYLPLRLAEEGVLTPAAKALGR